MKRTLFFKRFTHSQTSGFLRPLTALIIIFVFAGLVSGFAFVNTGNADALIAKATPTALPAASTGLQNIAGECRTVTDGINELKKDTSVPEHFMNDSPIPDKNDFDPNTYFEKLTHITLQDGYVLDYLYFSDELGGLPLVYARKTEEKPFQSYDDFLASYHEEFSGERSYSGLPHSYEYLEKIQIDKTPESYFEYVSMALLGSQYYLHWHGLYNDTIILCDSSDIEKATISMDMFDLKLPENVLSDAQKIDFNPTIKMDEKTVTVRFIVFSKWGGFAENVYVLDKDNPYELIDQKQNTLVEYDCGVSF